MFLDGEDVIVLTVEEASKLLKDRDDALEMAHLAIEGLKKSKEQSLELTAMLKESTAPMQF